MRALYSTAACLGLIIAFSACDRKKSDTNIISEEATSYAEEQLALEQIYNNTDRLVERVFTLGSGSLGNCANMWYDTTLNPQLQKLTIDFGSSNCLGYDGRYRKGRVVVEFSKNQKVTEKGYYSKITFENYVVDDTKIGGSRQVWNKGKNESGNIYYEIVSQDNITLKGAAEAVTGGSKRQREWVEGVSTPQIVDDKYRITGNGTFVGVNRIGYTVEIVRPLIDAMDCNWINLGTINIYPEGSSQRVLDFGEGQCESDATINVNGAVRKVAIP